MPLGMSAWEDEDGPVMFAISLHLTKNKKKVGTGTPLDTPQAGPLPLACSQMSVSSSCRSKLSSSECWLWLWLWLCPSRAVVSPSAVPVVVLECSGDCSAELGSPATVVLLVDKLPIAVPTWISPPPRSIALSATRNTS